MKIVNRVFEVIRKVVGLIEDVNSLKITINEIQEKQETISCNVKANNDSISELYQLCDEMMLSSLESDSSQEQEFDKKRTLN